MKTSSFNYDLPAERIAQYPPKVRGTTNLLVIDRKSEEMKDRKYSDLVEYINKGDIVILNNTKVDKVRVFLTNPRNQKKVQCIFLGKVFLGDQTKESWEVLVGGAKKIQIGDELVSEGIEGRVNVEKDLGEGIFKMSCIPNLVEEIIKKNGHIPLPPYMKREDNKEDIERYNTVFAKIIGSSAAPTASLNLTKEILKKLKDKGVQIVEVELRVGWGTFAPIRSEEIEEHKIHEEYINVSKDATEKINETILSGGSVWAFGTTVTRTLESCAYKEGGRYLVKEYSGPTGLYITPDYEWKIVNHLITNFHAPESSLLVLVSAFASFNLIKKAYNHALKDNYNFLSYGDSMLII